MPELKARERRFTLMIQNLAAFAVAAREAKLEAVVGQPVESQYPAANGERLARDGELLRE